MPPDYSTWQRSGRLERRGFEIKPSDKPIIITVAVIGGVFAILALFWIARCVRRKPAAPLPPARPLSTYYGSGSTDALSAKRDAPNASPGSDTSSWHGGISRDAKFSSSGTSTPTQGLLRTLEMSETDPEYVAALHKDRPRLPWTHAPGSSVSLASSSNASSSAAVVPDFTPISGSSTSPSPSLTPVHPNSLAQQDTNRARHQSGNSISKHSIVSVQSRHSIRAPNSLSRNSLYTPPPSAVRGAPHKTGIQIILPEPLGPQSHVPGGGVPVRSSSRSSTLGGHQSKRFSQSDSWTDFQLDKMARNRVGIHGVDEGNNRGRELVDREGRPLTILSDACECF